MIPMGVLPYVVGIAVAAGALGLSYYKGYQGGKEAREPEIVALKLDAERQRLAALTAEAHAEEAANNVRIEYRTRTETIIKESEAATELVQVITRDHEQSHPDCVLPASLRLLWNRASPDRDKAKPSDGANDAPVTVAELAEGVRLAQEAFERNAAQQVALQNYLAQIQEAPAPK